MYIRFPWGNDTQHNNVKNTALSLNDTYHNVTEYCADCHYAEGRYAWMSNYLTAMLSVIILNVIMLNVVAPNLSLHLVLFTKPLKNIFIETKMEDPNFRKSFWDS
jgi:hypothetical protein